jgi:hypothetical protein
VGRGKEDRKYRVKKEVKCVMRTYSYSRGLAEEARRLREEGEARSRRQEARAVRADWKAKSIAKKPRQMVEAR